MNNLDEASPVKDIASLDKKLISHLLPPPNNNSKLGVSASSDTLPLPSEMVASKAFG
jgi:hypothetical protein